MRTIGVNAPKIASTVLSMLILVSGSSFVSAASSRSSLLQEFSALSISHHFFDLSNNLPQRVLRFRQIGHAITGSVPVSAASGITYLDTLPHLDITIPSLASLVPEDVYCGVMPLVSSFAAHACGVPAGTLLTITVPTSNELTVIDATPREIGVAGTGIKLIGGFDPRVVVPHIGTRAFSVPTFPEVKKLANLQLPRLARVELPTATQKMSGGMVLGASTSARDLSSSKASVPFLDRVSLSLYCSLASFSTSINSSRCNYDAIAEGRVDIQTRDNGQQTTENTVTTAASTTTATSSPVFDASKTFASASSSPVVYVTKYITEYVGVPGPAGQNGRDGKDGKDGANGITVGSSQIQSSYSGFVYPSAPTVPIGISTISYLKDTVIDAPNIQKGTAANLYLTTPTLDNGVFNGFSLFHDTAEFTGTATVNNFVASSSQLLNAVLTNSTTTNAVVTNATTTNAYIDSLTVGASTGGELTLNGNLRVNGTSTLATTTATSFIARDATTTTLYSNLLNVLTGFFTDLAATNATTTNLVAENSTTTNAFIQKLTIGDQSAGNAMFTNATTTTLFATSSNFLSATTTNLFTQNLSVGNAAIQGDQSVYGSFAVTGTSTLGANVFLNGNVVVGTSSNEFFTVNALVNSHFEPAQNKMYDLGSPSFYWRNVYADTINVNTLAAASTTISGTSNNIFTINSDNSSTDGEDASLVFFRGLVTPNALIRWNSTTKRLESNMSLKIQNETPSVGTTTLTVKSGAGQGTTNLFELADYFGTRLSVFNANGWLGLGTTSPSSMLTVTGDSLLATTTINGTLTVNGNTNVSQGGTLTVGDKVIAPGEIGAGTSSPSGKISIQSTLADQVAFLIYGSSTQNAPLINVFDYPGSNQSIFSVSATGTVTTGALYSSSFNVTGQTTFANASTTNLTVSNNAYFGGNTGIWNSAGKVGVGTTTPAAKLDVVGTNNSSSPLFQLSSVSGGATTTQVVVTNTGNVGIGTTTPAYKLDIAGGERIYQAGQIQDSAGAENLGLVFQTKLGPQYFYTGYNAGGYYGVGYSNSGVYTNLLAVHPSYTAFKTTSGEVMRVNGTNVGIGTTSPSALFTVGNNNQFTLDGAGNVLAGSYKFTGTGNGMTWTGSGSNQVNVYSSNGVNLQYYNGSAITSGLSLTNTGNVGIGTTTPTTLLSVASSTATGTTNLLSVGTTSPILNVLANGYVGIGTTNPIYPLDLNMSFAGYSGIRINNNTHVAKLVLSSNSRTSQIQMDGTGGTISGGGLLLTTAVNVPIVLMPNNVEAARITSSGNVGIGTTTPGSLLSVQGDAYFGGNIYATGTLVALGQTTLATASSTGLTVTGGTYLATAGGSVGIGTTTPAAKFVVNTGATHPIYLGQIPSSPTYNILSLNGSLSEGTNMGLFGGGSNHLFIDTPAGGAIKLLPDGILTSASTGVNIVGGGNMSVQSIIGTGNYAYFRDQSGSSLFDIAVKDTEYAGALQFRPGAQTPTVVFQQTGNVGIGTTTPGSLLSVQGNAYFGGNVTATGTLNIAGQTALANASTTGLTVTGGTYLATTGGNVGIGLTNPGAKLEVQGSMTLSVNGTYGVRDAWNGIEPILGGYASGGGSYTWLRLSNGHPGTYRTDEALQFQDYAGNTMMTLLGYGYLGIGTTTPAAKLEVVGTNNSTSPLFQLSSVSGGATTTQVVVTNTGNVGIGTTNPNTKFEVGGPILVNTSGYTARPVSAKLQVDITQNDNVFAKFESIAVGNSAAGGFSFLDDNSFSTNWISPRLLMQQYGGQGYNAIEGDLANDTNVTNGIALKFIAGQTIASTTPLSTSTPFAFFNASNELMRLTSAGSLGLGTTSPVAKLSVNGDGYFAGNLTATGTLTMLGQSTLSEASTTDLTVANNAYFGGNTGIWNASGNVGIGTTTPNSRLSVSATTTASQLDVLALSTTGNVATGRGPGILFQTPANNATALDSARIAAVLSGPAPAATDLVFQTHTGSSITEKVRITSTGNVGIGTTTPSSLLHLVSSTGGASAKIESTFAGAGGRAELTLGSVLGDTSLRFDAESDGNNYIQSRNYAGNRNQPLILSGYTGNQGSSVKFDFATSLFTGNVGIGTTTPQAKLHIAGGNVQIGEASMTSGNPTMTIYGYSTSASTTKSLALNVDTAGNGAVGANGTYLTLNAGTYIQLNKTTNLIGSLLMPNNSPISMADASGTGFKPVLKVDNTDGVVVGGSVGGGWASSTLKLVTGSVERVRIDANGNVGIGTMTPGQALDVVGNIRTSNNIYVGPAGLLNYGSNQFFVSAVSGKQLSLGANGANSQMVIDTTGNVGIGTTTPAYKIDVLGTDAFTGSMRLMTSTSNNGLYISTTNANVNARNYAVLANSLLFGDFAIMQSSTRGGDPAGGNTRFYIDSTGNVGVGTTTVSSPNVARVLRVANTTSASVRVTGGGGDVELIGGQFGSYVWNNANNFLGFATNNTEVMRLTSGGFLGLGTTSPSALLSLAQGTTAASGISFGGDTNLYRLSAGTLKTDGTINVGGDGYLGGNLAVGGKIYGQSGTGYPIVFANRNDGTEWARMTNGNFGIGTTTPTALLSLNGSTTAAYGINFGDSSTNLYRLSNGNLKTDATLTVGTGIALQNNGKFYASELDNISTANNAALYVASTGFTMQRNVADTNPVTIINQLNAGSTGDILDLQAGSATKVAFLQNGNVGIGTSTPTLPLSVQGDAYFAGSVTATGTLNILGTGNNYFAGNLSLGTSTSDVLFSGYQSTGSTTLDLFRLSSDVGSSGNIVFRVQADGSVFSDAGATIGSPADVAESYPAMEAVDAGTVVAFSTTTVTWSATEGSATSTASSSDLYEVAGVRKATTGGEAFGVISTRPGLHLGADMPNGVPVALSGRVPVKVTTENGEVHSGDYLTVSNTMPGYAMKLTGEGRSIGRAVSDYVQGRDKIMMIVETGYQKVDTTGRYATTTGMLTTGNVDLNANGVAIYNIKSLASANGTWSIDETGRITAKVLCLEDVCIDKTQLSNMLNSTGQTGVVAGTSTTSTTTDTTTSSTTSTSSTSTSTTTDTTASSTTSTTSTVTSTSSTTTTDTASSTSSTTTTTDPSTTTTATTDTASSTSSTTTTATTTATTTP